MQAGLKEIPAYIRSANDQEALEIALIENIQREDLNAIEIGLNYQRLMDECDLNHEELAIRLGKKRTTITNYLRLLKLPPEYFQ
jgi:ParB family chromosome partitioning protein